MESIMESIAGIGSMIRNGLEKPCPEGALSCYSLELTKAASPAIVGGAVVTATLALAALWKANRDWKIDVREHCQYLEARESYITAMTLTLGTITVAATVIFASTAAIPTALTIGAATLISLGVNHYTHSQLIRQQKMHA